MALKSFRPTRDACRRNSNRTWDVLLLSLSSNKRLGRDASIPVVGIDPVALVIKAGVTAANRSFLLASRNNVLYKANTSFCIPDFAPMMSGCTLFFILLMRIFDDEDVQMTTNTSPLLSGLLNDILSLSIHRMNPVLAIFPSAAQDIA